MEEKKRIEPDEESRREIEALKRMSPQERAKYLGEATVFCLRHGLIMASEAARMQKDAAYRREMAWKALARRQLWRRQEQLRQE